MFLIILICLDISLYRYLLNQINNKKAYVYENNDDVFVYQKRNLELDDINKFVFEDYFKILSFNDTKCKYDFDNDYLYIHINNNDYKFKYHLIEPKTIEKVVYVKEESNITTKDEIVNENYDLSIEENSFFYVDNEYFNYPLDTDLQIIRNDLMNNIHSSYQVSIDYSTLNTSYFGQYSVFYLAEDKKIEIIIEIS